MTEEDKLLMQIMSQRKWYGELGISKTYASTLKENFLSGRMTFTKKCELLHALGYRATWSRCKGQTISELAKGLDLRLPDNTLIFTLESKGVNRSQARRIIKKLRKDENKKKTKRSLPA